MCDHLVSDMRILKYDTPIFLLEIKLGFETQW